MGNAFSIAQQMRNSGNTYMAFVMKEYQTGLIPAGAYSLKKTTPEMK